MRGLSLVAESRGHSSSLCAGLSLSRPLLLRSTGSRRAGSVVVVHGPSCSAACGIFPDQGSNPCPLHRQADSQPLRHQGSPRFQLFTNNLTFSFEETTDLSLAPGVMRMGWSSALTWRWVATMESFKPYVPLTRKFGLFRSCSFPLARRPVLSSLISFTSLIFIQAPRHTAVLSPFPT